MNVKALKPAVDVNPEPEIMLASPIEACPVSSNHAQLADSALMGARSLALTIVATIAVVFALQGAEKFLIPLLLGIIIAYTLNPLVVWMERVKIPRVVGTIIVMLAFLCGSAFVTISRENEKERTCKCSCLCECSRAGRNECGKSDSAASRLQMRS